MCAELFIIFPYYSSNVCGIHNISSFIPDTDNLYLLSFFFFLSVALEVYFTDLSKEKVFSSFDFSSIVFLYSISLIFLKNLFVQFCLHWVFVAAHRLSVVSESGGYSPLRCTGFSMRWLLLLLNTGYRRVGFSSCGSPALEHRLSSCGARAQLLRGMWDLPRPGLELVYPELAGGFLTTAPPEKPNFIDFFILF